MFKQHTQRDSHKDFKDWVDEFYTDLLNSMGFILISEKWDKASVIIEYRNHKMILSFFKEYLAIPEIGISSLEHKFIISYTKFNIKKINELAKMESIRNIRTKPMLERFSKLFSDKGIHNIEELKEDYNVVGYSEVKESMRLNAIQLAIDLGKFNGDLTKLS